MSLRLLTAGYRLEEPIGRGGPAPATALNPGSGDLGTKAVAFSPDGQTLAAGDVDGSTYLWRLSDASLIGTFPIPGASQHAWAVAFSPSGGLLATGDRVGGTDVWKIG